MLAGSGFGVSSCHTRGTFRHQYCDTALHLLFAHVDQRTKMYSSSVLLAVGFPASSRDFRQMPLKPSTFALKIHYTHHMHTDSVNHTSFLIMRSIFLLEDLRRCVCNLPAALARALAPASLTFAIGTDGED